MEKEITTTNQTTALADSLIVVQQLPIIKEQLHSIKAQAQESVKEALSLACTEETLKVVKERRAALNRDRKDLDARRMAVKKQIMQPFEDFDEVYKECVTDVYGPADEALKGKITDVEAGLKADKEKKVKDYFAEMVKASGVEWVTYEDVGVAVTLTASLKSLKAKVKEYLIQFCFHWGVPTKDSLLTQTDDIGKYLYLCLENRRCAICNQPAEVHHVDRVGMGRDREAIVHVGLNAIALCRRHHEEAHRREKALFADYHIYGIKLDRHLCKVLSLNQKPKGEVERGE